MNRSSPPKKQPVPFGINGQRENLLESTPAGDNTASYANGFPPVTMILKAAGGLPPKGQDMNQILFELSDLMRWASAGAINSFDAAFSTAIGGYPSGAMVFSDSGNKIFISVANNNTDNPNTTSTGSWKEVWTSGNLVKQTGPFDATAGSLLINGAWGWGGKGQSITMSTTDFLTWCRTGTNGSRVFRNDTVTPHSIQFGTGLLVRAGNTWGAITFGYEEAGNTGVRIAAGNESGTATATYNLWTDKNLANPATLDTAQTFSGSKTFLSRVLFSGAQSPAVGFEVSGMDPAVIGSRMDLINYNGSEFRLYVRQITNPTSGERIIKIPTTSSGTALVSNNNAVSDANGIWKVPGSPALTPASIGALAVNELAGIPQPFPGSVAPSGWLKCNGQAFNTTTYPILAALYPSGYLPNLRGEFIRGWDDGRGVDTGRALMSYQGDAIRNITATRNGVAEWTSGEDVGAFSTVFNNDAQLGSGTGFCRWGNLSFDASRVVPTASENRPRNIAFNYIVRAA